MRVLVGLEVGVNDIEHRRTKIHVGERGKKRGKAVGAGKEDPPCLPENININCPTMTLRVRLGFICASGRGIPALTVLYVCQCLPRHRH